MKRILIAALTLGLVTAMAAEARDRPDRSGRADRPGRPEATERGWQGDGRPRGRPQVSGAVPRGPAWRREAPNGWERGQTLPQPYWGGAVDYRSSGLRRPPSGYAWVRVGRDFVLMDTRTGLVLDVIPTR
jgi:Ni/Co efflux regulator RcnB